MQLPKEKPFDRPTRKITARAAVSAAALAAAGLSGCAVGPDFVSPPAPDVSRFTPENLSSVGGRPLVVKDEIPKRWWEVFHNKNLNRLVEATIEHNPSLQAAEASIKTAYFAAEAQKGGFLPSALLNWSDTNNLQSGVQNTVTPNAFTNPYGLFLRQVSVSYTPDIWGQNRRAVESLEAQTDQQRYQLEATYLSLTSNVATAAVTEASLRGQIAATRHVINIEEHLLGLLRRQYAIGSVAQSDVLTQEAQLAQVMQLLPPLEKQLAQQRDLLTALAGRYSTAQAPETFTMNAVSLPRDLPLTLPSSFVRQRPDVRAAEAAMHSASAQIGVAIAARLPNVTLSTQNGFSAYSYAQLFTPGTGFYTLAAGATQPLFDGFALLNKQKAAEAGLVQAEANYRQAVITGFQNVADALRALQADAKAVKAAVYAETTARKSLDIIRKQLDFGSVNVLALLNAEQTYLQASVARVQAEGSRLADVVALFMALGGGWKDENLKRLSPDAPRENPFSGWGSPAPQEVDKIDGPVNSSWFPSFWD
ncbi:efflux transporter outer membrane subunit [Methylocystis heyeri]|uniref:Efflux transporter outer membrane subunit n=1 Tax=Methylocystis heyeri TaxID=391905 RepID=A0A6B8KCU9_9HYPH|nr:efflux transporter outer membrane subunit [Methylocystis heyeri]QGM45507.1 efflux transporter outer membrane subunit [Methylocystis heyeri]